VNEPKKSARIKNVDPLTLAIFVLTNKRYSAIDKLVYIGYNLLYVSVALSIIGLILLVVGGTTSDNETSPEEVSQMYSTYFGILLLGVPAILLFRMVADIQYKGTYIALKNKERKAK
jgi:hypothetical protein